MSIFDVFSLLGGLALFLYGMNVMSAKLEKLAGSKLETIFEKLTSNIFKSLLLGIGVTAIIQSSSATTVMLVGFVNSGIMTLSQVIPIIMGSNIGTTVTSWLLSMSGISGDSFFIKLLNPKAFSPILALIGIVLTMTSKKDKNKDIGGILLGFAILMTGMETMSGSVEGLKEVPQFTSMFTLFSNPILGVLVGAVLTAIIQSSSASVGILQALSTTGSITFGSAVPIIMGQNIGTCVTALLSSIGANKSAKRVAIVHLYFNIIGTVIFMVGFYGLNAIINFSFIDDQVSAFNIAVVHTIFNVTATLILLPFNKLLEKLAYLTIKDDQSKEQNELLDERLLNTPTVAVENCHSLTVTMGEVSKKTISTAISSIGNYTSDAETFVSENETLTDDYEDKIGTYLVKLSSKNLSENDSKYISEYLHIIGDFERIADHANNVMETSKEMYEKNVKFSKTACNELNILYSAINEILSLSLDALQSNDTVKASNVEPLEEAIDRIILELKNRHIERLKQDACTIENGFLFSDILTNLERVSDHCSNIAVCIIQINNGDFETHRYINDIKNSGEEFEVKCKTYLDKYALPAMA